MDPMEGYSLSLEDAGARSKYGISFRFSPSKMYQSVDAAMIPIYLEFFSDWFLTRYAVQAESRFDSRDEDGVLLSMSRVDS
jgi:hypothetical protein